jgi:hypothetical protein
MSRAHYTVQHSAVARRWLAGAALVWLACAIPMPACAAADLGSYQAIIDRKPFGRAGDPASMIPTSTTLRVDSPLRDIKMCAIIESDDAPPRVGLQNLKTQKSYLLSVGDMEDGLELVEADFKAERALIRIDAEEQWVQIGGAAVAAPASSSGASRLGSRPPGVFSMLTGLQPQTNRPSYASMRAGKRAEAEEVRRKRLEAATNMPPIHPEVMESYLKEYQMNLIRSGGSLGPALPIPLTPDMDDQLVREGVLPPRE